MATTFFVAPHAAESRHSRTSPVYLSKLTLLPASSVPARHARPATRQLPLRQLSAACPRNEDSPADRAPRESPARLPSLLESTLTRRTPRLSAFAAEHPAALRSVHVPHRFGLRSTSCRQSGSAQARSHRSTSGVGGKLLPTPPTNQGPECRAASLPGRERH